METAINSKAVATLQAYIGTANKIIGLTVQNNWLVATIDGGSSVQTWRVKNK